MTDPHVNPFSLSLPRDVVHNVYRHCDSNDTLMAFSHVCHMWRQTAHSFTGFWARIDLHLHRRDPELKLAYWLQRAGQRLLTINVYAFWNEGAFDDMNEARSIETLVLRIGVTLRGLMDRWESFHIDAGPRTIELLLPVCAGYAPKLKYFSIDAENHSSPTSKPLPVPLLSSAGRDPGHNLSVSIKSYNPRLTTFGNRITELSMQGNFDAPLSLKDILYIFRACPNLVSCDLSAPGMLEPDLVGFNGFIELAQIATLTISLRQITWTTTAMSALWSIFDASRLLSSVFIGDEDTEFDEEEIAPPFQENPLTLENIETFGIHWNPFAHPLLQYLTLPRVKKLALTNTPNDVVYRVIASSPDLRSLSLYQAPQTPANPNIPPISLPALISLSIHGSLQILDGINAPKLTSLSLEGDSAEPSKLRAPISAFFERSASDLIALSLNCVDTTDEDILWLFERVPKLEALGLSRCSISDAVLMRLAKPPSPEENTDWCLSHLKRAKIYRCSQITPNGVIQLLASRNSGPASHITGCFTFAGKLSKEDRQTILSYGNFLDPIQTFLSAGLNSNNDEP
ncbi:hypothetical protein BOTBODRAFT_251583 [Botryobasidium botryosum FD-172 SS1]|uniref:F-box domain-containing protein n=1 Tax=Botryobasidium botryosum (strain FD-172 SS1) TaxID=930990 RepID=A0A067MXA7_BOTB1|nr:hypothetical protein BOTBODRAFT_251583 [Botryobasidium botryosum FD-172 SS1]